MDKAQHREHVQTFGDALRAKLKVDRAGLLERLVRQDEADEAQPGDEPGDEPGGEPGEGERSGDEA